MRRRGLFGTLDQSVEFTAVQPDATTIRAVIDFDALAIGHGQVHVLAGGAQHGSGPRNVRRRSVRRGGSSARDAPPAHGAAGWLSWTHLRRGAAKVLLKADGRLADAPEPEARIDGDSARELLPFEPRS